MALLFAEPVIRSPSMAGDGPVLDLGGPVRDHDHGIPEPGSATRAATGFALGAALAHGPFQLGFQLALALDVDGW